jgi:hypothetical protein
MKKICLTVVGLYIGLFAAFSQSNTDSSYRSRKLKIEEINLVSSYYHQEGDHAAVTGGIGSQKLTDFSNSLEVKLIRYDRANRKQTWSADIGLDHYTSASSDKIDPKSVSSASFADTRIYPSISFSRENEKKGTEWGAGLSYSGEYDYTSIGATLHGSKKTANKMGELTVKGQVYLDQISLIYPIELRDGNATDPLKRGGDSRNSYSLAMSWSQIINQRFQLAFLLDLVQQQGYLSLPFNRVYFTDGTVHVERLPDSRFKVPLGFRANYFAGDRLVVRSYYRYYVDNWGLSAHTASLETSVKINPFFSIAPFYRFYQQTGVDYFEPYLRHSPGKDFYTSNYDLSKFTSHFFGTGIRLAPPKGVFGIQHFNSLELRYGHYTRSNTLQSNIVSVHLKWK